MAGLNRFDRKCWRGARGGLPSPRGARRADRSYGVYVARLAGRPSERWPTVPRRFCTELESGAGRPTLRRDASRARP